MVSTDALDTLNRFFGYRSFRDGQEPIVRSILQGQDTLAVMPTGAGKSVCFQVPALMMPGITLVISPLISLMKDQVTSLIQSGIPGAFLNSSLTEAQYQKAISLATMGKYKIIYVAPERLLTERFLRFARQVTISQIAVDEAHCVSQWGQDFRPSYLNIPDFVEQLPVRPVVTAFTATATRRVREDVISLLKLREPFIQVTGFDRPNLFFDVRPTRDKPAALIRVIREHPDRSGIVYCATRKLVEEVTEGLCAAGFQATRYHAGLDDEERKKNQEDFLFDRCPIMVATNAFGMGIDKSDLRFVVHYNMPGDMESYYQEAGRAGRDGEPADCVLLYSARDVQLREFLINKSYENPESELDEALRDQLRERDYERLRVMEDYCRSRRCLRVSILCYFGEEASPCGSCGNCLRLKETADITADAEEIIRCVRRFNGRFGRKVITSVLTGTKYPKGKDYDLSYDRCGVLSQLPEALITEEIDWLVETGLLAQNEGRYPTLYLGNAVLRTGEKVMMPMREHRMEPEKYTRGQKVSWESAAERSSSGSEERKNREKEEEGKLTAAQTAELFDRLRKLRLRLAQRQGVPAFVIFGDGTLRELAREVPLSMKELLEINGIGPVKADKYGLDFLREIKEYLGM